MEQEEHKYFAFSFQDLVQLAKQEKMLIRNLKTVQESITQQLITKRMQCQEENKFSMSSIVDISRTLPSASDILGGAIGLIYIQLYYDMKVQDMVKGSLTTQLQSKRWEYKSPHMLAPDDVVYLARAAETLGRLDMQIDWLDFALNNTNLSEPKKIEFRRKRELAAKNSDKVLLSGGGFTYDSSEKKFLTSKPHLLLHKPSKKEIREIMLKQTKHKDAVAGMPHTQDMFNNSGYINRLLTIRPDLSGELCRGDTSRRQAR